MRQGLAGAADATNKSAPTLSRRILALERRLGQNLFERLPTGYKLTADGKRLFAKLVDVEQMMQGLDNRHRPGETQPVKLSAGTRVTHFLCVRMAPWIQEKSIPVEFIAADKVLDIVHREAVIGIRNHRPEQPKVVCQPIQRVKFATYAVNDAVTDWVQVVGSTPSAIWVARACENRCNIKVSHPRNALDVVNAGLAKAVLPTFIGDEESNLRRVSDEITELEHKQWLVSHQDDRHLPEVRETLNWLKQLLGEGQTL